MIVFDTNRPAYAGSARLQSGYRRLASAIGVVIAAAALILPLMLGTFSPPDLSSDSSNARARAATSRNLAPPPEAPPPVEPLVLKPIAEEDARAVNDRVPFVAGPIIAARPFTFAGNAMQLDRARDCLAAAMIYEAGDDSDGQRAVGQVVLNRVRHPAFPKTVCGVVFQGSDRQTGCQFTFTCDGALNRQYSGAAWNRARAMAQLELNGLVDKRVGLATHYHTDWVVPYWSDTLDKLAAVETHLFFRWKGGWGTPAAFRSHVNPDEPMIAKLAAYSPAHGPGAPLAALASIETLDQAIAAAAPATTAKVFDNTVFIAAPASATPASLKALALAQCGERDYCKLFGWSNTALVPANGELTAVARKSMSFSYLRDRKSGFERVLFDCAAFANLPKNACMKS